MQEPRQRQPDGPSSFFPAPRPLGTAVTDGCAPKQKPRGIAKLSNRAAAPQSPQSNLNGKMKDKYSTFVAAALPRPPILASGDFRPPARTCSLGDADAPNFRAPTRAGIAQILAAGPMLAPSGANAAYGR
jgi:hypothetical protein